MNTISNNRKRRRKNEGFEDMPYSSSVNQDNAELSSNNKWMRRLHSLRRSLWKRKLTNLKEFETNQGKSEVQGSLFGKETTEGLIADITCDNRCKENIALNGWQINYNERQSPLSNGCTPKDSRILNQTVSSDNNKTNASKRIGFHRRTIDGSVQRGKCHKRTSKQYLQKSKNESINGLEGGIDCEIKQSSNNSNGRKNKRFALFASWFKLPSRTSSEKNLKRRGQSISTGNFNEPDSHFKLLTDVKFLRDPGYWSSSGESLDLGEEKYQSLRRSRASLIDIKWHKHAKSEGNLASPVSRKPIAGLSSLSTGLSRTNDVSNSNIPRRCATKRHTKQQQDKRQSLPANFGKCLKSECEKWEGWERVSTAVPHCRNSLGSSENIAEDEDVYLTAEEFSLQSSPNLYLDSDEPLLPSGNKEIQPQKCITENASAQNNETSVNVSFSGTASDKSISSTSVSASDIHRNTQRRVIPTNESNENIPRTSPKSLHKNEEGTENMVDTNNIGAKSYVCKNCLAKGSGRRTIAPKDFRKLSLGQLTDFNDRPVVSMRCTQCRSPRLLKQNDACHDVLITRPPKKPAPKPPTLVKNKSKSLTALGGKFPILSEQLDLNETSSLYKLNDSCSDNLCELLSQPKNVFPTSEGVYVGIMGDQGVILRKRWVHPKQKRVVSMPSELLENVMEIEGVGRTSIAECSTRKMYPTESLEDEVYLNSNSEAPSNDHSNTPSSGAFNCTTEKELCMRSVSISSIDVQDVSMKKKTHSQSVPCLAINKNWLDGMKVTQVNENTLDNNAFSSQSLSVSQVCVSRQSSSTAQSMISLNFQQSQEGSDDTSDKITGKPLMYAEALWDHVTMNEEELCFTAGQAIAVYDIDDPEWWFGLADEQIGWFPAAFVRIPVSGELLNKYHNSYERKLKNPEVCLSKEEIRAKIVEEIVSSERDYVQNLNDIVKGYLKQAYKRPDMFNDKLLAIIFSNVEKIYHFHVEFLRCIEQQYHQTLKDVSCVGKVGAVFVQNKEKFELYSEYCNNHPRASSELKQLLQQDRYRYFFEACRLLHDMISISLDGFLLTPVQKICKYPLQLQELLKYTSPDHSDYDNVMEALKAMREVASSINEKKRQVENIQKIAEWQLAIEQWEGEDVLIKSSQLVHSGEVTKLSKGKAQDVTLFLFDHQLVYCKKDLIKKRSLEYKGRIVLENYKFEKLADGEVSQNGVVAKNAWRLSSKQSNTCCLFQAKSSDLRDKWIGYFLHERKIVYETTSANIIPVEERLAAMDEARNAVKSRKNMVKGEKKYGNFNTVSRAIGQMHYGSESRHHKIDLPPPVSSAMLFQRDQARSSFLRNSAVFKKRQSKPRQRLT